MEQIDEDIAKFKEEYFSVAGGKYNLKAQIPHLRKLADRYSHKYETTGDWRDCLKAHALFNSVAARGEKSDCDSSIYQIQQKFWKNNSQISFAEHCEITKSHQSELLELRERIRSDINESELSELADQLSEGDNQAECDFVQAVKGISSISTAEMNKYANGIMTKAVALLTRKPPCPFIVVAIGSLARGEATPYSDLEYMFLTKRMTPEIESYFETLAVTTYFLIGNLRETNLSHMDIDELDGWFDDCARDGFQIDGLQNGAGNIPTGNGKDGFKNAFIMTPEELLEEYKQCFADPDRTKALRGDLTAMLHYMKAVYTYDMSDSVLDSLREEMNNITPSQNRVELNEKMLQSDITKFDFRPSPELEGKGYTLNVKKEIFRFPSILFLDLAIVNNISCSSTWEVPELMVNNDRMSSGIANLLSFLLASACYIRLGAYLYHDAHDDRLSIARKSEKEQPLCSKSPAYRRYFVNEKLFFAMCSNMIPLKNDLGKTVVSQVLRAQHITERTWQNEVEIFHSCGRFSEALYLLKQALQSSGHTLDDSGIAGILGHQCSLETMKAIADTLLRSSAYPAALSVYEYLLEKTHDDSYKLRIAECLRKMQWLKKSLEILQLVPTESADKHYQLGAVYSAMEGKDALAETHLNEAMFAYHNGDYDRNRADLNFAQLSREKMSTLISSTNPKTASCLMALGELFRKRGDHKNAREYLKKSFEVLAEAFGEEAVVPAAGHYLKDNGLVYSDRDDHDRAKDYFIQSLAIYHKAYGNDSHHIYIANALYNLGKSADIACEFTEAEAHYRESLYIYREIYGPDGENKDMARILYLLGDILVKRKQFYEADGCYSKSLDTFSRTNSLSTRDIAHKWRDIGMKLIAEKGERALTIRYLTTALSMYRKENVHNRDSNIEVMIISELARIHKSKGDHNQVQQYMQDIKGIMYKFELELDQQEDVQVKADIHIGIGKVHAATDEGDKAVKHYTKALTYYETCLQLDSKKNQNVIIRLLKQIAHLHADLESDQSDVMTSKLLIFRKETNNWENVTVSEILRGFKINNKTAQSPPLSSLSLTACSLERILVIYKRLPDCDRGKDIPRIVVDFLDGNQSDIDPKLCEVLYEQAIMVYTQSHTTFDAFIHTTLCKYLSFCEMNDLSNTGDGLVQIVFSNYNSQAPTHIQVRALRSFATHWSKRNSRLSIIYFERALTISHLIDSNDDRIIEVANIHQELASVYNNDKQKNRAVKHYNSALQQYSYIEKLQNSEINSQVDLLHTLASLSEELSIKADRYYLELLSLRNRTSTWTKVTSREMSRIFMLRYNLSSDHAEYEFNGECFHRAIEVYKELQKAPDHNKMVSLLSDMAQYHRNKNHKLSEQCIADALQIHQVHTRTALTVATNTLLHSLLEILASHGKTAEADLYISDYLKVCEHREEMSTDEIVCLAHSWLQFGTVWYNRKSFVLAFDYLSEAIRIFSRCPLKEQQLGLAEACKQLEQLGEDLQTIGEYQNSKEVYIRALRIYGSIVDVYDDKLDALLYKLGTICTEMKDYEEAKNYISQMVKERKDSVT